MQTLKIQIPDGFMVDSFDAAAGVVKFKEVPRKVTDRIKTIEDVCKEHGFTLESFDDTYKNLEEDEKAYLLTKMLAESLNEGWTPDWSNANQYKYYPWFEMEGSSGFRFDDYGGWHASTVCGSRLCFKSSELARYAGTQFTELYKSFMVISK